MLHCVICRLNFIISLDLDEIDFRLFGLAENKLIVSVNITREFLGIKCVAVFIEMLSIFTDWAFIAIAFDRRERGILLMIIKVSAVG